MNKYGLKVFPWMASRLMGIGGVGVKWKPWKDVAQLMLPTIFTTFIW